MLLLYSQYLQYTPPKRRFCSLPLMCFFLGGNASSNNRYVNVRDRSYREYSQYSGFCTADTVCISIILRFDPASPARTSGNSGGYRRYGQYSGVLFCSYYEVFLPLPLLLRVFIAVPGTKVSHQCAPSTLSKDEVYR